ncbi:MAG: recombinase family protein [Parcubacteria group bacterium]
MDDLNEQLESKKVALYIRVSTEEQAEKYGPDLQKEALIGLIKSKGRLPNGDGRWVLAGENYIYMEDGVSGTKELDERPAFSKMKEDIMFASAENKPFDIVAVYKIDRFARKLKILLDVIDFFGKYKIEFISANESIDTSTPFGKAMLNIIGVIAELERETIAQRTQDGRRQAIKKGVVMSSYAPFGYMKGLDKFLKIQKEEAETVRHIFDLCINKKLGSYQISRILMEEESLSPEASAVAKKKKTGEMKKKTSIHFWRPEVVRKILKNEVYIGNIYYNKAKRGLELPKEEWVLADVKSPQILDYVTFEKAQRILESVKHERTQGKSGHIYLLSGLLRCDSCFTGSEQAGRIHWIGERKKVKKSGNFSYYYKCGRKNKSKHDKICATLPLPAKEIEDYILNFCKKIINNPIAVYNHQLTLKSSKKSLSHLKDKQAQITNLINGLPARRRITRELRENGHITREEVNKKFDELSSSEISLRKELKEIERQISENILSQGYQDTLSLFSEKYRNGIDEIIKDRKEIHTLFHELIEEIIVYSRPIENEKLAGKRKKDQQIPFRLHIKLKLPQDILQHLTNRFGVEISTLSG